MASEDNKGLVEAFLALPIASADGVFSIFAELPGAVCGSGKTPMERFVYIPGTRKDRVLLVAHGDTVWDAAYGKPAQTAPVFRDGIFYSENPACGIGADDRAGCAMLYALRNCGHSLLLLDGEERGKIGARYLRKNHKKLFRELNGHRFMIELDWEGTGGCLFNQVDNTNTFKHYIENTLGFHDDHVDGGCDLQVLCHRVCGVNVGVGYHRCHSAGESLSLTEWENTLQRLSVFLSGKQPRFSISIPRRIRTLFQRAKGKLQRLLKIKCK